MSGFGTPMPRIKLYPGMKLWGMLMVYLFLLCLNVNGFLVLDGRSISLVLPATMMQ